MQLNTVGIGGEVRCVITRADGTIKTDTGYQKNLILNQGLDFFGGDKGTSINASCAIGSGNSTPAITQTGLDAYIAQVGGTDTTSSYAYVDKGDNLYRLWEQKKYRFTGLSNVNISEVGLVSTGTTSANYYLTTRALIKDSLGAPTSISVKAGETLDIYYKIHKVIDTSDKSFLINMLDGNGGAVPYNVVVRPAQVGNKISNDVSPPLKVSRGVYDYLYLSSGDLATFTSKPTTTDSIRADLSNFITIEKYTQGSFKIKASFRFPLDRGNTDLIRTIFAGDTLTPFFLFQVRFGSVANDSPITKTANDTLTIPLEFSWGRYEGEL